MKQFLSGLCLALVASTQAIGSQTKDFNPSRNLYFGDTHVHTALSFDAYLMGDRAGLDEAYQFAMGEPLTLVTGERAQLSRPLDFVVIADHAESYGIFESCAREDLAFFRRWVCDLLENPSIETFLKLRGSAVDRPPVRNRWLCMFRMEECLDDARVTWRETRLAADKYNQPGSFTAFVGYEYSPPLEERGKLHRVVMFRNGKTPERAVSAYDALTAPDLWRTLEAECSGDCDFLTIPHNMNRTWGLAYSGFTIDGDPYDEKDWALRMRNEPLAEVFQIKGSSECGYGLGANDEECNFELIIPLCEAGDEVGCSGPNSFARQGLKVGMELQQELGFNPIRIGFIGSTDTHNSNPGDTEEDDWVGKVALLESPAEMRLGLMRRKGIPAAAQAGTLRRNPGGLGAGKHPG